MQAWVDSLRADFAALQGNPNALLITPMVLEIIAEKTVMHPDKVRREKLNALTDLPNIGPSLAADLRLLGIDTPQQLLGQDAVPACTGNYAISHKSGMILAYWMSSCRSPISWPATRQMSGGITQRQRKRQWPSL